jgi:hypothetical protein
MNDDNDESKWRTWRMGEEPMPKDFPKERAIQFLRKKLKKLESQKKTRKKN